MAFYRVSIAFPLDSDLPRDYMTINPHYFGDNASALANAIKSNLIAHTQVGARPFFIKVYDAQKAPPSYPLATAEQVAAAPASTAPREVALCLSYFSAWNRPSYRGRLYLPHMLFGGAQGLRPTTIQRDAAMSFKSVLEDNLPANVNFVVWSRKLDNGFGVTDFWVDDEWDIVRSRGLRPTGRTLGKSAREVPGELLPAGAAA